jgi:rhodanese-related sulfurtransferase
MVTNTISTEQIRQRLSTGESLCLIDVRTPAEYDRLHAAGARSIPLDRLDPQQFAANGNDRPDPILVICQSGQRAARARHKLAAAGIPNVYCVDGGTNAWRSAGLPVECGRRAIISLERQVRIAAGALILLGLTLAWAVHPAFLIVPLFIGSGLLFAGITDYCGMGMLLARMPWNR